MKREGGKKKKSTMGPGEKREGGDQERHPPAKGGGGEGLRRSSVSDQQPEGGALGEDRKFPFSLFCFPRTQNLLVGDVCFFVIFTSDSFPVTPEKCQASHSRVLRASQAEEIT